MKKITALLCAALLGLGVANAHSSEIHVENQMKTMAKALKSAEAAKTSVELKKSLEALKQASQEALAQAKGAQDEMGKTFTGGMQKLIAETDAALDLAANDKFAAAHAALDKIKAVRNEFHKKLR